MYENVNVIATINHLSDKPDFAVIYISGGMTVRPELQSISEIAVFPTSVDVISVGATLTSYVVKVFVKDPAALSQDTILIKAGVIYSYWGQKTNLEKDVSITVMNTHVSESTLNLWPTYGTIYTSAAEFVYSLPSGACPVDVQSFSGANVEIVNVEADETSQRLIARLIDSSIPGSISFLGYTPDSCTSYNYPVESTVMVVKETVPTYEITYKTGTSGCVDVEVVFSAPVKLVNDAYFTITPVSQLAPSVVSTPVLPAGPEHYFGLEATMCISSTSDTLLVSINRDAVKTPSDSLIAEQEPVSIFVSKLALVIKLLPDGLPEPSQNMTYIIRNSTATLSFSTDSSINIGLCDFSKAFTSDYNVALSVTMKTSLVILSATTEAIDHHVIAFHADRVTCDGSFTVEFLTQEFKYAYDPHFNPGDIIITRVNTYYSAEFDFVPLRKVFSWNKIYFTDAGWVNEVFGFIDHGSDGYISWTPKTDVEAGTVQQWSYKAMTDTLDPLIPFVVDTEYSFNYEQHGFLLDFQDNLFIYVTDDCDTNSRYDSYSITFIFGVYWSSSEWAPQTNNYLDITSEYSSLPQNLANYSIALGLQATPVPRGVNYMSINQDNFFTFTNTYNHIIEKIIDKQNWLVSQKDRFTISPQISYMERPMDFTVEQVDESTICFNFVTPYTVTWSTAMMHLFFNDEPLEFTIAYSSAGYCVSYDRPTAEGVVRLEMEKGTFSFTTTSTLTPVQFECVAYSTEIMIYNVPELSVDYHEDAVLQKVTITSSVPCVEWGFVSAVNSKAVYVSQSPTETILAFAAVDEGARFYLDNGFCKTAGQRESVGYLSSTLTVAPTPGRETMLHEAFFYEVVSKYEVNTVSVKAPSVDWTPSVDPFKDMEVKPESTDYDEETGIMQMTFRFSTENGEKTVILPQGLFVKGQTLSQGMVLSYLMQQGQVDVMQSLTLPWAEPIREESVGQAVFSDTFVVLSGSTPTGLLRFENMCRSIGYMMGASISTSVSVAIMDGDCVYGVHENMIVDPYNNTNAGFEATLEFDFLPPMGVAVLVEDITSDMPEATRFYWNQSPVVAIFFNEPLVSFNEAIPLITVDNCNMTFVSHIVAEDRSVIRYVLSGCQEGPVRVDVVENILMGDDHDNTCLSQECISNFPLLFETDYVVPSITLSTDVEVLHGSEIDITFSISEPDTLFTCASIGIAIQEVSVSVEQIGESVCRYTFSPEPVNGTYILFLVPAGRFTDKALNPNTASNTLAPLVLNKGAQLSISAPQYTDKIQTEFTLSINYTWLCPNYEYLFPSTFEYDRNIARIEKNGESRVVDGTVIQTFSITFLNFDSYPEDRYKNVPIYIPSRVCVHPMGIYNNGVTFYMTFDNTPTVPSFTMLDREASEEVFTLDIAFAEVMSFGEEDPAEYVTVGFADQESLNCNVTRYEENSLFIYRVVCPLEEEGTVNVTIHQNAVIELTGTPSASFSRQIYIDGHPPMLTLSYVEGDTFGPIVTELQMRMNVSEIMSAFSYSCFVFENVEGLSVNVVMTSSPITSNQIVRVRMTRMLSSLLAGSFNIYVKDNCMQDLHGNYNIQSNVLTFNYDFTAPEVTLICPTQDVVLNTLTITGSLNEPCQTLTPSNVVLPSTCSVRDITQNTLDFSFSVSCYETGRFQFGLRGVKDLVGNEALESVKCEGNFTIYGPVIQYTIHNLIDGLYINTPSFTIELGASPSCATMNLTESNVMVENVENLKFIKVDSCQWLLTGSNIEEGMVGIRILSGAAVDVYGGPSSSRYIDFRSYQSKPKVMSVSPRLMASATTNDVVICYDWTIVRGEGRVLAETGCSDASVMRVENNCVYMRVAATTGERCHLYLEEDFVQTAWNLSSESRYVLIEIDDHSPVLNAMGMIGETTKMPVADETDPHKQHLYVNSNFILVVAVDDSYQLDLDKLDIEDSTYTTVNRSGQYLQISFTYDNEEDKDIQITMNEGLLTDMFGRKSERMVYLVHYSKATATPSMAMNSYSSETPITVCVSFDKDVIMTAENVVSAVNFTLTSTSTCKYLLSFTPEVEGMYSFELQNVMTIFGNPVEGMLTGSLFYYTEQPVMTNTVSTVEMTTRGSGRNGLIQMLFSHHMADLPDTLDEMFHVLSEEPVVLSNYFNLVSATVNEGEVSITLAPKPTSEEYLLFSVEFADNAFVDMAGNTAVSASLTLVIDNRPPTVVSVLHNGGTIFSKLPLSLVIKFSKPVTLTSNFVSMISAISGSASLTFSADSVTDPITEVTVVSMPADVSLTVGMEWSVTVAAGIATDLNGVVTESSYMTTLMVTDSVLTLDTISYSPRKTPGVMLTFNKGVKALMMDSVTLVNAVVKEVNIDDKVLALSLECATQGEWSIHFGIGAIEGIDESVTTVAIEAQDVFDSVAPVVTCEVPTAIGTGLVSLICSISEPIQTTSTLFSIVMEDMELPHTETLSEDGLTLLITFTAVETYIPDYHTPVFVTLNDCSDTAGNLCFPVSYMTTIDFTSISVEIDTSRVYLHSNETVTVTATFSKSIVPDNVELVVDYNDEMIGFIVESYSVVVPHLQYSWVVKVMSTELTSDVVPMTFVIASGMVSDVFGNTNTEGSATIYLNEQSPELSVEYHQNENIIEMSVVVLNGPLGSIDAEMFELSENTQFDKIVSFVSDGSLTMINMTFVVTCETSCPYTIRFLSEKIFNLAGNQMEHDLVIEDVFVRAPVVTVSVKPYYAAMVDQIGIIVSERSDMNCMSIQFDVPEVQVIVPKLCLNAMECMCDINFSMVTQMSQIHMTLPAHSIVSAYHVTNENSVSTTFYYSPVVTTPLFSTQWDVDQPVVDIEFTVSAGAPGVDLTESMIQCTGCEISNWALIDMESEIKTYSFRVSFLDDMSNYARVFIEAGTFVDPFGRPNAVSEKVLRRNAEAVTIQKIMYSEKRKNVLELQFSKPVHACSGEVILTCLSNSNYTYSYTSQHSAIRYSARKVFISLLPYGDLDYEVSWEETAFCDSTNYPVATECTNCRFHSAADVPTPPLLLDVEAVTAHTATVHYMITHDGGEPVVWVAAYLMPAADSTLPVIVRSDEVTGEISLTGLSSNTNYIVLILVGNIYGYSMPSTAKTFLTAPSTPISASDLRICDLVDPVKVDGVYVYSEAEACWSPSTTRDVFYRLELSTLVDGTAQEPVTVYEGSNTTATISIPNDVTSYRLILTTQTIDEVEEGDNSVNISADFVTHVDLENVSKFPQGAGIVAVAERLTADSVRVSFTHPLENYFRIEKYLVQYGNVFEDVLETTGLARESYTFRMDKCLGDQVTLTVRAGVRGNFWGLPSNRVTVYCKTPRLQLVAEAGYDYVAFRVTSEVATTATCTLKSQSSADILGQLTVEVHPINVASRQLFKSLNPDTDYTIDCEGYDLDFMPVAGHTSFYTLSNFVLPEFTLGEIMESSIGSYFVEIPVESVSVPGTVYCVARPADQLFQISRSQYISEDYSTYLFPGQTDVKVVVSGLKPSTEYRARCMFDPDYETSVTVTRRRLEDSEMLFKTPEVSVPTWKKMEPFGSVAVAANTQLVLEASMPVRLYLGVMVLRAVKNTENDVQISSDSISINGSVVTITLPTLVPGEEYALEMPTGTFVDAVSNFPLPGVSLGQKVSFTVFDDIVLSQAPVLVQTVPETGSVSDIVDSDVYFTFDRSIRLKESSIFRVRVDGSTQLLKADHGDITNNRLIIHTDIYFPERSEVEVSIVSGSVCSLYGACVSEMLTVIFTVGDKNFDPALLHIVPTNGQTHVPATEDIVMTFNKAVVLEDDFFMVFVDENTKSISLSYGVEKSKITPRLRVDRNVIRVRGDALPGGHTYTAMFASEAIRDTEGRSARGVPSLYSFSSSQYGCSGNYIFENMADECQCYVTDEKCECRCGKENPIDTVIGMFL